MLRAACRCAARALLTVPVLHMSGCPSMLRTVHCPRLKHIESNSCAHGARNSCCWRPLKAHAQRQPAGEFLANTHSTPDPLRGYR